MKYDKQTIIDGLNRTIEQNEEKIIEYSKPCDSRERRIERKRKDLKPALKVSCISSSASLITLVVAIVLKVTLAPNYIFIVNEILPRLTKR